MALASDSEQLRLRLETMAICWCFLKLRAPSRRVLQTVSMALFDRYTKWLFGPRVWGLATRDASGRALSTPTLQHVITFDAAIRKAVVKLLNDGVDYATALERAKLDPMLLQVSFLSHIAVS